MALPDRGRETPGQSGASDSPAGDPARVRLSTLLALRWIAVGGQLATLLIIRLGFGFDFPVLPAGLAVLVSGLLNLMLAGRYPPTRQLSDREAAIQLGFDLMQLCFLLYLTGGLTNPFALLILVPVTISATVLSRNSTLVLLALGLLASSLLALWHRPLPWSGTALQLPPLFLFGVWAGIALAMIFLALYAARVSAEARKRALALAATEAAMARAQKMSDLGALAAAAAHELGTPLGTITLAARDLLRETAGDDPRHEDIALINSQIRRCRLILQKLSEAPVGEDEHPFSQQPIAALAGEAARPFEDLTEVRILLRASPAPGATLAAPQVPRRPEILHGLANFIENAVGFARSQVVIDIAWSDDRITIEIADDGPGFDPAILKTLGEPYITNRTASADGTSEGMGLGIFIAKTLLERTGAGLDFLNDPHGGARIRIAWPRHRLETRGSQKEQGRMIS